jgi:hypothetical protein
VHPLFLSISVMTSPFRGRDSATSSSPSIMAWMNSRTRSRSARHAKSPNGEAEGAVGATGHRHGHRSRSLLGSFGRVELEVPTVVEKINSRLGCRLRGIRLRGNVTPETTRPSIHTTPATAPAGMEVRCDD